MKTRASYTNTALLFVILCTQFLFIALPGTLVVPFFRIFRPAVYSVILLVHFFAAGSLRLRVPKARQTVILAGIGALLYFSVLFITGMIAGFGKNPMASGFFQVIDNIWIYAGFAIISELLRLRILRSTPKRSRYITAAVLTAVYAFVQLENLGSILKPDGLWEYFLSDIFPVTALHFLLSYMAYEGSVWANILIRGTYYAGLTVLPILPNVSKLVWAVISTAILFATFIIYHLGISDKSKRQRLLEKRRGRYGKRSVPGFIFSTAIIVVAAAFSLRAFPYFPVVILTESMTGAVDIGSLVFMEKLRRDNVFGTVKEGDIIQFKYKNIEIAHRVIEIDYNSTGQRVYITKGDFNPNKDENPVEITQVVGVLRGFIPYIGYPVVLIRSLFG